MSRRNRIIKEEEKIPRTVSRERLREAIKIFRFVKPYSWQVVLGLVLLFISSMVFMAFPYLSGLMVDVAQDKAEVNFSLRDLGIVLIIVLLLQGVVSYTRVMLFAHVSERSIADVRNAVYAQLVAMPISFFETNRVGELISRVTADADRLYNAFSITLAEFLRQIIILVAGTVLLFVTTPRLALTMLASFPIIVVAALFFGRIIRKLSRERQNALAETNTVLSETLQSIHTVKTFNNERYEQQRYGNGLAKLVGIAIRFAQGRALFTVFIVTVLFGALFFLIWQAAVMVQDGSITAGMLISFVAYTAIIGGAIASLGNFYTQLLGAIGATERIREILYTVPEVDLSAEAQDVRLSGDVRFENVHFNYPSRPDVPVLRGLQMHIKAGQKVALVGLSGAGKTTIVHLLLRLYDIQTGNILADNMDIQSYDLASYRRNFSLVPQEVILFGGSIRDNIRYGRTDASEEDIIEAAKQAHVWEFVVQFPEGLDTIVGERGVKLSGGQRQRIAIARAILRDPAILLLDEATSNLDAESESVVQEALATLMHGRTSIIVAHRLATIRDADCIYVLENGKVVESGTHQELFEQGDGVYANLAKLQFEEVAD